MRLAISLSVVGLFGLALGACEKPAAPAPEPAKSAATAVVTATAAPVIPTASASAAPARPPVDPARQIAIDYVEGRSGDGVSTRKVWRRPRAEREAMRAQADKACKAGDTSACSTFAALTEDFGESDDVAGAAWVKACKAGDQVACARLALYWPCLHENEEVRLTHRFRCTPAIVNYLMYANPEPEAQKAGMKAARSLGQKACDSGVAAGCAAVADSLTEDPGSDWGKARELHQRACDLGSAGGCDGVYRTATHLRKTTPEAAAWAEAAAKRLFALDLAGCDEVDASLCAGVAIRYRDGFGVPKDVEKARAYFKRACDAKNKFACEDLERLAGK